MKWLKRTHTPLHTGDESKLWLVLLEGQAEADLPPPPPRWTPPALSPAREHQEAQ